MYYPHARYTELHRQFLELFESQLQDVIERAGSTSTEFYKLLKEVRFLASMSLLLLCTHVNFIHSIPHDITSPSF